MVVVFFNLFLLYLLILFVFVLCYVVHCLEDLLVILIILVIIHCTNLFIMFFYVLIWYWRMSEWKDSLRLNLLLSQHYMSLKFCFIGGSYMQHIRHTLLLASLRPVINFMAAAFWFSVAEGIYGKNNSALPSLGICSLVSSSLHPCHSTMYWECKCLYLLNICYVFLSLTLLVPRISTLFLTTLLGLNVFLVPILLVLWM